MDETQATKDLWASIAAEGLVAVEDDEPMQAVIVDEDAELADLLADPGTGPDSYIRQAQILAQHELGMLPDDATEDEALEYGGALDYVMALQLCKMAERPILGLRKHVYKVMVTGSWAHTPLASTKNGKPVVDSDSGEVKQAYFQSFEEWFTEVADASRLNDDYRSTTLNGVTRLLPAIVTQGIAIEVPGEDGGESVIRPVELDELLNMDQSKFGKIVAGTHNLLRDATREGDSAERSIAVSKIGKALSAGLNGSKRALDKVLIEIGTRKHRAPALGYRFALPGGGYGYMILPSTEAQDKSFNVGVDGRVAFENATLAGIAEKFDELSNVTQA